MATYKMKSTQRGVRKGEVHSVLFREGKTYEIDDDLAGQFKTLDAVEDSNDEPVEALAEDGRDDLHENWLDTDPAVLRHGELTAAEVVARDESADPQTTNPAEQVEGKAEGESQADPASDDEGEEGPDAEGKPGRGKKSAGKAK